MQTGKYVERVCARATRRIAHPTGNPARVKQCSRSAQGRCQTLLTGEVRPWLRENPLDMRRVSGARENVGTRQAFK